MLFGSKRKTSSKAVSCPDRMRLVPDCQECIPGLKQGANGVCAFHPDRSSPSLRDNHIEPPMRAIQQLHDVGELLGKDRPQTIVEVGPTDNPLWTFFPNDYCPSIVVLVQEPTSSTAVNNNQESSSSSPPAWQSVLRPCSTTTTTAAKESNLKQTPDSTHLLIIPMRMQQYLDSQHFLDMRFDAVVCMGGCSSSSNPTPYSFDSTQLAMIPRPFRLYLEYASDDSKAASPQFNQEGIVYNVCGKRTKPIITKEYEFDNQSNNHPRTLFQSYQCKHFVRNASEPYRNLDCDPTEQSYQGMACMSEMQSILRVREPAYFPVITAPETFQAQRHHNCSLCLEMVKAYGMTKTRWRAPFRMENTSAATTSLSSMSLSQLQEFGTKVGSIPPNANMEYGVPWIVYLLILLCLGTVWGIRGLSCSNNPSAPRRYSALKQSLQSNARRKHSKSIWWRILPVVFVAGGLLFTLPLLERLVRRSGGHQKIDKLLSQPSIDKRLRLHDWKFFFDYAQKLSHEGKHWDAYAAGTVTRAMLHGGCPTDVTIKKGGILYETIPHYNRYLARIIDLEPQKYPPTYKHTLSKCPPHMDASYKDIASTQLEPILPDSRNHGFHELGMDIDLFPYRLLPTFPSVSQRKYRKTILLDVGTNGFFASAKALIDSYLPYQKFDEIHMFEPDLHGMSIPGYYRKSYNITFHHTYVKTGTRDSSDIVTLLEEIATPEDFVALKYDVDHGASGVTMEWGFLADLMNSKALRLVDEFFIELHFNYKDLKWNHGYHSMEQAYDVMRQLRQCGVAIHAWP